MSLGKLLTTGKSLIGLHNSGARYQLRKGALPKFESSKNPFTTRPHEEAHEREPQLPKLTPAEIAAAGSAGVPPASAGLSKLTPAEVAASKLKKTQALPVPGAKTETPARNSEPMEPVKPAPVVDNWLKKINPLVWLGNRKTAEPKAALPRFGGKTPVQGELSLDNIKVMRNDLSETDMEIVPMKARRPIPVPAPELIAMEASAAAMAIPELPPATSAWEYLGERLLGKH